MWTWIAMGLVVGVSVAPAVQGLPTWLAGVAAVALALCGCGVLWRSRRLGGPTWGVACVLTGIFWVQCQPWGPLHEGPVAVRGTVIRTQGAFSAVVRLDQTSDFRGGWTDDEGSIEIRWSEPLEPGQQIAAWGHAGRIEDQSILPGQPDPVRSAWRNRIRSVVRVQDLSVVSATRRPDCNFEDATGVLCAIATGNRTTLDPDFVEVLRRTGTSHLLAISGFHVGAVGGLVGWIALGLLRLPALWWSEGISVRLAWIAAAATGWAYVLSAGSPVSAERAAWMMTLSALARCMGARLSAEPLLAMAAIVMVAADPGVVGSPSFQLSFGALLGILRLTPRWLRWIPPDAPWWSRYFGSSLAVTAGASLGTLPAVAWWFQQVSPASPLTNAVAIPWTAAAVVPSALCAVHGPESWQGTCAELGTHAVQWMWSGLSMVDVGVWTPAVGPVGALALTVPLWIPRRPRWWIVVCVSALLWGRPPPAGTVTVLDVGQGDATWVEVGGKTWLVDGGPPSDAVLKWLRRSGIRHIDTVVATHANLDHTGGLEPVLRELTVGSLWVTSQTGALVPLARSRGIPIRVRPTEVLHPRGNWPEGRDNDDSLVLRLAGVLLPGDIEGEGERALASTVPVTPVLRLPHHGSATSSSELLLQAVQPSVAVVSAGRHNPFGHPHVSVLDRLRLLGVPVYRTDRLGTLQFRVLGQQVWVRHHRAGRGWTVWSRAAGTEQAEATPVRGAAPVWSPRSPGWARLLE